MQDKSNIKIAANETVIETKKYKGFLVYIVQITFLILYVFLSFGTIFPYIDTGEFSSIWPTGTGSIGRKVVLYYMSWIWWTYSPTTISVFRVGDVKFYSKYVEVEPFLFFVKKRKIFYDQIYAKKIGERAYILAKGNPGKWYLNPFIYWKSVYWHGIVVTNVKISLKNPECVQGINEIIKKRVKYSSEI